MLKLMESSREKVSVRGIVQGVGFRPFVSRLARQFDLVGWVRNTSDGVSIEVQGPRDSIERFALELERSAPPQSCIIDITREDIEAIEGETEFEILASPEPSVCKTLISPDLATCGECLAELRNPSDRRWSYPFINCTNCGPRFSII
ncbi:MAG TPA: acylphosphatase, partial [bacterium]|nr:acylphosphatase [bacterium]